METLGGRRRAWGPVLLGLLVLAAYSCGGDEGGPKEPKNKPTRSAPAEEDESSSPGAEEELPILTTKRFVTPSGNIHCESYPAPSRLICDTDYRLDPEPAGEFCVADWRGVVLVIDRFAGPSCYGEYVPPVPESELQYEQIWKRVGVTCLSENSGLTCRDGSGNGFTVAMAGWSLHGKEDAAMVAFPELRNMVRMRAQDDFPDLVESVDFPELLGGEGCGELQEAVAHVELTSGSPADYRACFVTGTWHITTGQR